MTDNQIATESRPLLVSRWIVAVALGGAVSLAGAALVSVILHGSDARAAYELRVAAEIEQENEAICQRLGFATDTAARAACVREMNEVRRMQEERRGREHMF